MLRVVIESPYANKDPVKINENLRYAREALHHSFALGEAPFASHLLYTQILNDEDEKERLRGLQACYEWTAVADLVAFYVDLGWSPGMIKALKMARILQRKVQVRQILARDRLNEPLEVKEILSHLKAVDLKVYAIGWEHDDLPF